MAHPPARHPRDSGYGHWRWQRISAVITLFLMVYFTYLMASLGPLNYLEAHSFVATPHRGIALGLLMIVGLFHAALGVQMIIEDYIIITMKQIISDGSRVREREVAKALLMSECRHRLC